VHTLANLSAFVLAVLPCLSGRAMESTFIDAGQRALRQQQDLPWYDSDTDTVRRVQVTPPADDPIRHSAWRWAPANRPAARSSAGSPWLARALDAAAWVLLGILLLGILGALIWWFLRVDSAAADSGPHASTDLLAQRDRLDHLPMPMEHSERNLLETARMYQKAGDFAQATIFLFAHMLVELDRHQLIRLARGKTNRQYLMELESHLRAGMPRGAPRPARAAVQSSDAVRPVERVFSTSGFRDAKAASPLAVIMRRTMIAFEDVFFGHHPITARQFAQCWDGLNTFQEQLEQMT